MKRAAILLFLAVLLPRPAHAEVVAGNASVIDGDTIEIHDIRVRIAHDHRAAKLVKGS